MQSPDSPPADDEAYVPVPEDFVPAAKPVRGPLARMPGRDSFLVPLAFYATSAALSLYCWQQNNLALASASGAAVFAGGEWWRLVTAVFLHHDLAHLASNGPHLLIFGALLRHYFGLWVFPVLALALGALANLGTIYFYAPAQQLLGASGMNFALVGLWLVLYVRYDQAYSLRRRWVHVVGFVLFMLFPSQFQAEVSYLAHAFGFAAGILAGILLWPLLRIVQPEPVAVAAPDFQILN